MSKPHNVVMRIEEIIHRDLPRVLILYEPEQEEVVLTAAAILGQNYALVTCLPDVPLQAEDAVVGLRYDFLSNWEGLRLVDRVVITTHCVDIKDTRPDELVAACRYDYLYTSTHSFQRDLARFLGFVLGQSKPHDDLKKKARTTQLSATFPDIRSALPNLDILSVGADSVELRVDLLRDPAADAENRSVPCLKYVGEQVMMLRQRTELPIIFTTRCRKENGAFPMDDPLLFYKYLRKGIQWGCEYIDVELWLPEQIRKHLYEERGNSKIISASHDYSGTFKWSSPHAHELFRSGAEYANVVKIHALINATEENYQLEYFRESVQSTYPNTPLSALNIDPKGRLSWTLNRGSAKNENSMHNEVPLTLSLMFTPITHPLLPTIAAPGQLSAAEINSMLHSIGQMPKLNLYALGNVRRAGQATFVEKCLNELSLPHQLLCVESTSPSTVERFVTQERFGGAFSNPPLPASAPYLTRTSNAASLIGQVDTIAVHSTSGGRALVGDNVAWLGIRAMLTRDFCPSAYAGQTALVLASQPAQASAAIYALTSLGIATLYTIGFKANAAGAVEVRQVNSPDDMKTVKDPFVVISALPADKSFIVSPLLRHYSKAAAKNRGGGGGSVFVDLSNGVSGYGDSVALALNGGWKAYGVGDVNGWVTVETLRLLVGQNVPFDFVRMAAGRSLFS